MQVKQAQVQVQVNDKQNASARKTDPAVLSGQGQDIFSSLLLLAEMNKSAAAIQDNKPHEPEKEVEKQSPPESGDNKISDTKPARVSTTASKGDKVKRVHGEIDIHTQINNEKEDRNIKVSNVSNEAPATVQNHGRNIKASNVLNEVPAPVQNHGRDTAATDEMHNAVLFKDVNLNVNVNKDSIMDTPGSNRLINDNSVLVNAVKGTVYTDNNSLSSEPVTKYVDQGNLIQYMSQQIIHAAHIGSHTARFSLRPAELGDVRLDISVNDKNVKALIVVENDEAKQMLESGLNSLRDELKNQGLNVEQFKVEINSNDFRENFKSADNREEKSGRQWVNRISGEKVSDAEYPVSIPILMSRGGISIFA